MFEYILFFFKCKSTKPSFTNTLENETVNTSHLKFKLLFFRVLLVDRPAQYAL